MGNIYVEQYKATIKGFHKKMNDFNAEIADNNKRFSVEYAEKANAEVIAKEKKEYESAKEAINNTFSTVRSLLGNAMFLSVESLTADRLFFEAPSAFDLTPADIRAFISRYEGNFTMTRLISDWINRRQKEAVMAGEMSEFADCKVILPKEQLEVYAKFGNSALSLIDTIFEAPTATLTELSVNNFANEEFASSLFAVIGDGLRLSDYKNKRIPEEMAHYFDNVQLSA